MYRLLFVCTGNICRSPTAEAVFRHVAIQQGYYDIDVKADSAGTHGYHIGSAPDPRTQNVAQKRGISMTDLRARKLCDADFFDFDLILAMDRSHLHYLEAVRPDGSSAKIALYGAFPTDSQASFTDVPDPYYGSADDFENVYKLIESHTKRLIDHLAGNRWAG